MKAVSFSVDRKQKEKWCFQGGILLDDTIFFISVLYRVDKII